MVKGKNGMHREMRVNIKKIKKISFFKGNILSIQDVVRVCKLLLSEMSV